MSNPKMREIGRLLKEEESRFIGYPEIEAKSKELGFGMTIRTLRFYVDEGILPPPKKVGKTPVYEEDWILNVLLSIHLMKTRLNRSLAEVRLILQRLQENPAVLADKLSVLYEDYVKGGTLKPVERDWLVEAFFGLLTGKFERARHASEVRISDLVRAIEELGTWKSPDAWEPPAPQKLRVLIAENDILATALVPAPEEDRTPPSGSASSAIETRPIEPVKPAGVPVMAPVDLGAMSPAAVVEAPIRAPAIPLGPIGPGGVTLERARALEETFVSRFEASFEGRTHVPSPLEGTVLKCGVRERSHLKRDHSSKVIDLMKRNRVYDRALLDAIPLDEASEYHVYQRSFLGKGELKVVVAALVASPLESFVTQRQALEPLGPREIERAVSELVVQDDIFYYVGLLSTTGWSKDARASVPCGRNILSCLVEAEPSPPAGGPGGVEPHHGRGNPWARVFAGDSRWGGLERLFDPETDREKVDRVRAFFQATQELKPKGGHVILKNVKEDLVVPDEALRTAVAELCATDPELSVVEVGGREILKRRRI